MWNLCYIIISQDAILDFKETGRFFGDSSLVDLLTPDQKTKRTTLRKSTSLVTWCVSIIFAPLVFLQTFFLWSIYEVEIQLHYQLLYFSYTDVCLLSEVGNGYWKSNFLIKQKNYDHSHRRTGNFLPEGTVNRLHAQSHVAQIFTKQSSRKRNEGHTRQQHRAYLHMKVARYSFSGSIPSKFERKLCRNKQTFRKINTGSIR